MTHHGVDSADPNDALRLRILHGISTTADDPRKLADRCPPIEHHETPEIIPMRRRTFLSTLGVTALGGCLGFPSEPPDGTATTTRDAPLAGTPAQTTTARATTETEERTTDSQETTETTETADATDEFRTITVPANEWKLISVGSGETFENVLIDMTAPGASAQINAVGADWTIRNVGFEGVHPGGNYLLTPAAEAGSTCTVENVYLGHGQRPRSSQGGIWVRSNHRGTIDWRNVNVQRFVDNGLYGTNSSRDNGGVVNVYDSYFRSNNSSNVRVGTADGTCRVENTVSVGDADAPALPSEYGHDRRCRGIWAWWGKVVVENCDIAVDPSVGVNLVESNLNERAAQAEIVTRNTRLGAAANTDPPDGVPQSAAEAARGR